MSTALLAEYAWADGADDDFISGSNKGRLILPPMRTREDCEFAAKQLRLIAKVIDMRAEAFGEKT